MNFTMSRSYLAEEVFLKLIVTRNCQDILALTTFTMNLEFWKISIRSPFSISSNGERIATSAMVSEKLHL